MTAAAAIDFNEVVTQGVRDCFHFAAQKAKALAHDAGFLFAAMEQDAETVCHDIEHEIAEAEEGLVRAVEGVIHINDAPENVKEKALRDLAELATDGGLALAKETVGLEVAAGAAGIETLEEIVDTPSEERNYIGSAVKFLTNIFAPVIAVVHDAASLYHDFQESGLAHEENHAGAPAGEARQGTVFSDRSASPS